MRSDPAFQLSVIIVNYNVRHFLEQALRSVQKASEGLSIETWVVDNNSQDQSIEMLHQQFPEVNLIHNQHNPGFAVANNQAIQKARGQYILLLNPDTVVQEDTFQRCLAFMEDHPKAGGLGIKMLDGSGAFLPESKRGFPKPLVAFCKAFGLSSLFPKSRIFNQYHLGFLSPEANHRVEVLSGAFMLMRKSVLDEIGLLDEAFFMYGEDIDLSYRIVQAGYENYYFSESKIIHYKGESTKKGSLNYVRVFYQAMIIFTRKHFQSEQARFFIFLLKIAIYFRAFLSLVSNLAKRSLMPLLDAVLIYGGLFFLKNFWGVYHFNSPNYFGRSFLLYNAPFYTLIWILALYFSGAYDRKSNLYRVVRGILSGTLFIAAFYGFLNSEYRSSRMLIVLGTFWSLFSLNTLRLLRTALGFGDFRFGGLSPKRLLIVGDAAEEARILPLLGKIQVQSNYIGLLDPEGRTQNPQSLGQFKDLDQVLNLFRVNELIFCAKNLPYTQIINSMERLGSAYSFRIINPESPHIIGSHSKNSTGELYTQDVAFRLQEALYLRSKRLFDLTTCVGMLLLFPLMLLLVKNRIRFFRNCFNILIGRYSWVGYDPDHTAKLPPLKPGVLRPVPIAQIQKISSSLTQKANFLYAKDYHWWKDLKLVFLQLRQVDKRPN